MLNILEKQNGYIIRKANNFDRYFAIDHEMLFDFLTDTQPEVMESLRKIYKERLEETLVTLMQGSFFSRLVFW